MDDNFSVFKNITCKCCLSIKMRILNSRIDDFNNGNIELDEDEVFELENEKKSLLNEYYTLNFPSNVLPLIS